LGTTGRGGGWRLQLFIGVPLPVRMYVGMPRDTVHRKAWPLDYESAGARDNGERKKETTTGPDAARCLFLSSTPRPSPASLPTPHSPPAQVVLQDADARLEEMQARLDGHEAEAAELSGDAGVQVGTPPAASGWPRGDTVGWVRGRQGSAGLGGGLRAATQPLDQPDGILLRTERPQ
jgi:hypothetical protein